MRLQPLRSSWGRKEIEPRKAQELQRPSTKGIPDSEQRAWLQFRTMSTTAGTDSTSVSQHEVVTPISKENVARTKASD